MDTCESCAGKLRAAVGVVATEIAAHHQERLQKLRDEMTQHKKHEEDTRKARAEFEREWSDRRGKLGL